MAGDTTALEGIEPDPHVTPNAAPSGGQPKPRAASRLRSLLRGRAVLLRPVLPLALLFAWWHSHGGVPREATAQVDRSEALVKALETPLGKAKTRQGIAMTDDHWSVVAHLRRVHLAQGVPGEARDLSSSLDRAFHDRGGTRWLYSLFPGGPVHQGCLIAGVPEPAHSIDPASGTCY